MSYQNMSPLNRRLQKSIELLKPPPKQTVSEWAVENRILSSELTAEHCVTRFHKVVARREWVLKKGQRRNEALDLFVYNFVALKILNPNFEVLEKNMAGVEVKPLKKVNKPYKIKREGSFVSGFK